ncbi:MAG: hypothetical protein MUF17_02465 [Syntrophales bacterium]|nr:hypothetical protein [Syntrophales bacterium]
MRLKSLAGVKKAAVREISLAELPTEICMTRFAHEKSFKINELVRTIHRRSYEWYGFTLAWREQPEVIVDIGLPVNEQNQDQYVSLAPEKIADYCDSLSQSLIINGWIHSHGELDFKHFSETDAANQATVLDYVTARLRLPVAKVEVVIGDLSCLQEGSWSMEDLEKGSVSLITDAPVGRAQIWETEFGGFCYAIVIGDDGWHEQEIHYKKRGILTGQTMVSHTLADIRLMDDGRFLTGSDLEILAEEVKNRLSPMAYVPPKLEGL